MWPSGNVNVVSNVLKSKFSPKSQRQLASAQHETDDRVS